MDRVVAALEKAGLSPPPVADIGQELGRPDIEDVLRLAAREGRAVAVQRDRYYAASELERFVALLENLGADREDITPGAVRDHLGLSRKYIIPLLEWADREGVTRRVGDARRLVDPKMTTPT